jgi:hypothetical protein
MAFIDWAAGYRTVIPKVRMVAPKNIKVIKERTTMAAPTMTPDSSFCWEAKALIWGT